MRRIIFRISMNVVIQAVVALLPPERDLLSQIMAIASLTIHNFPKNPFLCHAKNHQFISSINTVLHKHQRCFRLFMALHELPALLQGIGTAHLTGHRLTGTHTVLCHFTVHFPRGTDKHCVQFGHLQHLPIVGKLFRLYPSHLL